MGVDKDFYRLNGGARYYIPLKYFFNGVLEMRVRSGLVDAHGDSSEVPIFERFFAGGGSSIRGFEERGVGPVDSGTRDPVGGEALFLANLEYTIPIIDFVKFAIFFDNYIYQETSFYSLSY